MEEEENRAKKNLLEEIKRREESAIENVKDAMKCAELCWYPGIFNAFLYAGARAGEVIELTSSGERVGLLKCDEVIKIRREFFDDVESYYDKIRDIFREKCGCQGGGMREIKKLRDEKDGRLSFGCFVA